MRRIDFHSHILPNIDDGSKSVEESLAMLAALRDSGVSLVVATPHFYPDINTPERFLRKRNEAYERLREAVGDDKTLPKILLGAEVAYFNGMKNSSLIAELVIEGTDAILVELPVGWTRSTLEEIISFSERYGVTPVLAHIDRYEPKKADFRLVREFVLAGGLVQANATYFLKKMSLGKAVRLIENGYIHLLGSDCHNMTTRPPHIGEAFDKIEEKSKKAIDIIEENQSYVLE